MLIFVHTTIAENFKGLVEIEIKESLKGSEIHLIIKVKGRVRF